jgi:phytoene dehydrogenase-like protein
LSSLPKFTGISDDALNGTLVVAPSLSYLERAYDAGKYGSVASQPFLEATVSSIADNTLAPVGKHVMSIWLQYSPYKNNVHPEKLRELAIEQLSQYAPNLKSLVVQAQVITPHDFESRFNLSEGHLYGGEMSLAQAFFLRPIPGCAQYETPIPGLFLCGAATHPGGGTHGLSGRNAARELGVRDLIPA